MTSSLVCNTSTDHSGVAARGFAPPGGRTPYHSLFRSVTPPNVLGSSGQTLELDLLRLLVEDVLRLRPRLGVRLRLRLRLTLFFPLSDFFLSWDIFNSLRKGLTTRDITLSKIVDKLSPTLSSPTYSAKNITNTIDQLARPIGNDLEAF